MKQEHQTASHKTASRYRYLSILAPMAPHDTPHGRRLNMKLYCILRWFLYTQTWGSRFFSVAAGAALPQGAQGMRIHCAVSRETFLRNAYFQELLSLLKAERLTPCLYMWDGYADGKDKPMPTLDIVGYARRGKLSLENWGEGHNLDRTHIPYFAHQMLLKMKMAPLESMPTEETAYRRHFGL